jgi:transcriptional regulator with XRE-family HTH domain
MAEVRAAQGLNQIDFAELVGVSAARIKLRARRVRPADQPRGADLRALWRGRELAAVRHAPTNEDELNRMAAAIEWAFNFFEERDLAVTPANLTRAVAVILSILDDKASDLAKALPLLKQLFPETA